jgi:hypothetical protein
MNYDQRIVAFIDILGFQSLINETIDKVDNDDEEKINSVIAAYETIREVWHLYKKTESSNIILSKSKQISIFSDSIVVSFKIDEPSEVFYTLLEIKWLIMRLLYRQILCRGAVAIGKFIHSENYLFGPALVEAYTLELKSAMYPRVILDRSVVDIGASYSAMHHSFSEERKFIQSLLEQDCDGMYYIDYFLKAHLDLDDPAYNFPKYIENLGDIIRKGLMGSSHTSKVNLRVKYSWMREKYNNMVKIVSHRSVIESMKNSGREDLAILYSNLKKISPYKYNKGFQRIAKSRAR